MPSIQTIKVDSSSGRFLPGYDIRPDTLSVILRYGRSGRHSKCRPPLFAPRISRCSIPCCIERYITFSIPLDHVCPRFWGHYHGVKGSIRVLGTAYISDSRKEVRTFFLENPFREYALIWFLAACHNPKMTIPSSPSKHFLEPRFLSPLKNVELIPEFLNWPFKKFIIE